MPDMLQLRELWEFNYKFIKILNIFINIFNYKLVIN